MRFESIEYIDINIVLSYVKEAIENQKLVKGIKSNRSKKETIIIPQEFKVVLNSNKTLKLAFESLPPYKQREYCDYIDTAKRDATKLTRLEKITPMILQGVGLHDKYKNC